MYSFTCITIIPTIIRVTKLYGYHKLWSIFTLMGMVIRRKQYPSEKLQGKNITRLYFYGIPIINIYNFCLWSKLFMYRVIYINLKHFTLSSICVRSMYINYISINFFRTCSHLYCGHSIIPHLSYFILLIILGFLFLCWFISEHDFITNFVVIFYYLKTIRSIS